MVLRHLLVKTAIAAVIAAGAVGFSTAASAQAFGYQDVREDAVAGFVGAIPTSAPPIMVASDGESAFHPFDLPFDVSDAIQLNSSWGADPGFASAFGPNGWQRFGELGWAGRLYYRPLDIRTRRPAWLAQMRRVEHDMSECEDRFDQAKRSGVPDDYLLACLRHACRRYAFVAGREITLSRIADETRTPSAGSKTAADLRGLTIEARALEAEYSVLWNLRNRPEGLDVPLARMHSQVTVLDSLALRFADRH